MVKILVLGGAGFIGYHLLRRLASIGSDQITLVDDLSRGQLDHDLKQFLTANTQIEFLTGDLTKAHTFDQIGGPFDLVFINRDDRKDVRLFSVYAQYI